MILLDLVEASTKLLLYEIGGVIFLLIETYKEARAGGELVKLIKDQRELIIKLYRSNYSLLPKNESSQAYYHKNIKPAIPENIQIETHSLEHFLSDRFFGSVVTAFTNSLIISFELKDPLTASVTGIIPIISWYISSKYKRYFILNRLLSFVGICSVIGQMIYFMFIILYESTANGLVNFTYGFAIAMIILSYYVEYKYLVEIKHEIKKRFKKLQS